MILPSFSFWESDATNEVRGQQCDGVWRTVARFPFKQSMKTIEAGGWGGGGECAAPWPAFVSPGNITTEAWHMCYQASDRQLSPSMTDRAGAPDLGNATAEDCENQDLLALAPGACQISAGNPQGHRPRQDGHRPHILIRGAFAVWSALDY